MSRAAHRIDGEAESSPLSLTAPETDLVLPWDRFFFLTQSAVGSIKHQGVLCSPGKHALGRRPGQGREGSVTLEKK